MRERREHRNFVPGGRPVFAKCADNGPVRLAAVGFIIEAYNQNLHAGDRGALPALYLYGMFARRAWGLGDGAWMGLSSDASGGKPTVSRCDRQHGKYLI